MARLTSIGVGARVSRSGVVASGIMLGACSLTALDHLQSGSADAGAGSGAAAGVGAESASGGSSGRGGASNTAGESAAGGDTGGGGGESEAGHGGAPGSGGDRGGGASGAGGNGGGAAGEAGTAGDAGASAGMDAAGGAGASAGTAGSAGGPTMTYGVLGQSCAGELTCPGGVSCCSQLEVPSGTFQMGASGDGEALADEKPAHTTTLEGYYLDQFEVTVGRFRRFVEVYDGTLPAQNSGSYPGVTGSGWQTGFASHMPASSAALRDEINCDTANGYQTWTEQAGVRDTMPMNCVSFYVAFAFCIWDGGRLPSEAEWERAAAGGDEERLYPWGSAAPDPATHAVMNCMADAASGCSASDVVEVASRQGGAGRYGHLDLAGSVWEWTLDYYDATYYQSIGACNGCVNVAGSTPRVIRGGNFTSLPRVLRATTRASKAAIVADPYAGFRCARSP